jgi:hypothetical protein
LRATHAVLLILLAAARAQAQPASVPPPAAPFPLLDVPFVSQSEALCGGAAAAMLLRYWGERGVTAETFAPLVDRSAAGIRTTALVDALHQRGWMVTVIAQGRATIAAELANGRPLIALIEDRPHVYHYVVIVGATERAVIFHDPARAPLRVMSHEEFSRRSQAAGRWLALVLPATPQPRPEAETIPRSGTGSSCDLQVGEGVAQAQAGDLEAAERTLTGALACPGPSALRELAGVRLLQRRWDDVAHLAEQATAIDVTDEYSWKLLGTSRFLLNQPMAALDAWNHAGEPRLDLVKVSGLERTRQRPVEQMIGIAPGQLISPERYLRAQRALRGLPSSRAGNLEIVPVGQGLAELHATIVERPLVPRDVWSWGTIGVRAAVNKTVGLTLGSFAGAGERLSVQWRYWPGRPAIDVSLEVPARWPGTWGADAFGESQVFDHGEPRLVRRGGRLAASRWMTSALRIDVRGGVERWNTTGRLASVGATSTVVSGDERVVTMLAADSWIGSRGFSAVRAEMTASTSRTSAGGGIPPGMVMTVTLGAAAVSLHAPLDLWPASDTGRVRPVLARAHPLIDDGRVRVERLGRRLVYGSGEAQYGWTPGLAGIGATLFVDSVRTLRRNLSGSVLDVDVGMGVGVASRLVPGRVQLEFAHGLRDGADTLSVRYVAARW